MPRHPGALEAHAIHTYSSGGLESHAECALLLLEAGASLTWRAADAATNPAIDRGAVVATPLAAAAAASGMDRVLKRLLPPPPPPPPRAPPAAEPTPLRVVAGSWAEVAGALAGVSCLLRLGGDGRSVPTSEADLLRQWCRAGGRLDGVAGCVARLLAARRRGVTRRGLVRRGGWRAEAAGGEAAGDAAGDAAEEAEVEVWPASRFAGRTPLMLCAQLGMSAAVRQESKFKPQAHLALILTPTVALALALTLVLALAIFPTLSLPPLLTPLPTPGQIRRLLRSTAAEPPSSRLLDTPLAAADDPSW